MKEAYFKIVSYASLECLYTVQCTVFIKINFKNNTKISVTHDKFVPETNLVRNMHTRVRSRVSNILDIFKKFDSWTFF